MDENQEETIAYLTRPDSYGAGIDAVERIDTHASVLFLAGPRAYKLKRAVRFSYLDYSTPALRRTACERELALNRRTAPTLYLRVLPITRAPTGLRLGGGGEAVDWVVEMVRFDQADLFERMAEEGRLTDQLMRELADCIAEFHLEAETDRRAGGAAAIARVIAGNDVNLRAAGSTSESVDELLKASRDALAMCAALLDRRRDEGHVRLCHGDLHLRNICLIDGRPTLFDCVEFSDEIARIDVLYDLAFLIMDLHHRRLARFANQVLNRYLDMREEVEGLAALPLFLSLRAAIRAHTGAAAAARQPDRDLASAARRACEAYLAAASRFLAPVPPCLVAVGGLSGTGKSSLAYRLAPEMGRAPGARVLRSDVLRKRIMGVPPERHLGPEAYSAEISEAVYRRLCAEAKATLAGGQAVIADAVFLKEKERETIGAVARAIGLPFVGLWLEAPREVLEERLSARRGDASDATVQVLSRQYDVPPGRIDWIGIDARADQPEQVAIRARAAVTAALSNGRGAPG